MTHLTGRHSSKDNWDPCHEWIELWESKRGQPVLRFWNGCCESTKRRSKPSWKTVLHIEVHFQRNWFDNDILGLSQAASDGNFRHSEVDRAVMSLERPQSQWAEDPIWFIFCQRSTALADCQLSICLKVRGWKLLTCQQLVILNCNNHATLLKCVTVLRFFY